MSHAVEKLTGHTQVAPGPEANLVHIDSNNSGVYYNIKPEGEGLDEWFEKFQAAQREDGPADVNRFYEVLPRNAITKLSLRIPSGPSNDSYVRAACGYVAHKLLAEASYEASDVSYWYQLGDYIYGVWPMIAMDSLDRETACELLDSGGQEQHFPFSASWFEHYRVDGRRIESPLPAAGSRWIGVFNHEGIPKTYSASRHGRRMGHLVVNGGFYNNQDPAVNAMQVKNIYKALRIGLLQNITTTQQRRVLPKDPGYNVVFLTRRCINQEALRLRLAAPAIQAHQQRPLDRLNFIHALDVFGDRGVEILMDCQRRDAEEAANGAVDRDGLPEYFHTYNQMNRWFVMETGCSPPRLWAKTYDDKRYMVDPSRPERYLTLETVSSEMIRKRLDRIKVMMPNPGKKGPKYVNIFDAWLSHPQCNAVRTVVICPLASEEPLINLYRVPGQLNRWRHWDFYAHGHYDRLHEQYHALSLAQLGNLDEIRTINAFIYGMLCNQDVECFRMITLILANVLQRPDNKPEKAVFLKGPEGVGKSLFSKSLLKRVFGFTHATEFDRTDYIVGNFTEACSGKAFIILEEALFGGDKQTCGRFQQMVTGEFQAINGKFQAVRIELNLSTFWANTNRDFPITVNQNGRRYVFVNVSNLVIYLNSKKKSGFFNRIAELLDSDTIFLYAYFLSRLPLDDWFKQRNSTIIENAELGKQKLMSMNSEKPIMGWLMGCAQARTFGRPEGADKDVIWDEGVQLNTLYDLFCKTRKFQPAQAVFINDLCLALGGLEGFDPNYDPNRNNTVCWVRLPKHSVALAHLQKRLGGTSDVGSPEAIKKQLEQEKKMMKLSEQPIVTAESLLPPLDESMLFDAAIPKDDVLMFTLFGATDRVVVPCQQK